MHSERQRCQVDINKIYVDTLNLCDIFAKYEVLFQLWHKEDSKQMKSDNCKIYNPKRFDVWNSKKTLSPGTITIMHLSRANSVRLFESLLFHIN